MTDRIFVIFHLFMDGIQTWIFTNEGGFGLEEIEKEKQNRNEKQKNKTKKTVKNTRESQKNL